MITYNHELYIKSAIEGVLMQKTSFIFELVIGEDCSTDSTRNICEEYAKKFPDIIRLLPSEKRLGMMENGNRTFSACRGKYIAICEGDDFWTDQYKLQKQVDFLESSPEYGMISTDINLVDKDGYPLPDTTRMLKQREKRKPDVNFFDLLNKNLINTLTVCVRADLMRDLEARITEKNLWFVYDYWLWLNIALVSKIKISYEKTAAYRVHDGGISRKSSFFDFRKSLIKKDAIIQGFKHVKWYNLKGVFLLFKATVKLTMGFIIARRFKDLWMMVHMGNTQHKNCLI